MTVAQIILGSVVLALSVVTILCISFQQGKSKGLGAFAGGSDMDTFFGKNKNRSRESMLTKITIVLSVVLGICVLVLDYIAIIG